MGKGRLKRRSRPRRDQKPRILIATEDSDTAPRYFEEIKKKYRNVVTVLISGSKPGKNFPLEVLDRLERKVGDENQWQKRDQAWLVVDTDKWTEDEKNEICRVIRKDPKLHLGASNPSFELWLMLHFRDAWQSLTQKDCEAQLTAALGETYHKTKYPLTPILEGLDAALSRATDACGKIDHSKPVWPTPAQTYVGDLVRCISRNQS